ncbi:MAG: response regulator, partial [Cyanobacteria bacterium P01_H01_bin.105]
MTQTILVIEDEAQTRDIFLRCLKFEKFKGIGAENGSTGVRLATQHRPDLVVCDIMMPDMDGYEVLSSLRQNEVTASIPFIFLTAKVTMSDLRQGMTL